MTRPHPVPTDSSTALQGGGATRKLKPATGDLITIGKDVLELLSSAMYVDPLTIYREYVQNAADAIDDARATSCLQAGEEGRVEIFIEVDDRSIRIRDNGCGIPFERAAATLLSIGASGKRGREARGFRGVGRLAGLAYCRQLTFRTRASGDSSVTEVIWDCQKLKSTLRDVTQTDDLPGVMQRIVQVAEVDGAGFPEHFFEVELTQVVRLRKDVLLNRDLVQDYLAQVGPVPFAEEFTFGKAINEHLAPFIRLGEVHVTISPNPEPITRPYRDSFSVTDHVRDTASELELVSFTTADGVLAVGWVLHHSYLGSITIRSKIGGLRARAGNIQIGGADLMADVFPEIRFNGWAMGEIHIVDRRIVPNARRDDFEQNIHYSNLVAELSPLARSIARRCRTASVARHHRRKILSHSSPDPEPVVSQSPARSIETKTVPPSDQRRDAVRVSEAGLALQLKQAILDSGLDLAAAARSCASALTALGLRQ